MALIVQKFGGSSVADADKIRNVARIITETYRKGQRDGTLRTDMPEKEMFSATLHLMLAVVTRYAVGLAYSQGACIESELLLQKDMLMRRFCTGQ